MVHVNEFLFLSSFFRIKLRLELFFKPSSYSTGSS